MANNGNIKPSNFVLPVGVTIGGYFLGKQIIAGSKKKKIERLKRLILKTGQDIENEVDNGREISEGEHERDLAYYKGLAKSLNKNLNENRLDLGSIEQELVGEKTETKALRWKQVALTLEHANMNQVADEGLVQSVMDDLNEVLPFLDELIYMTVSGAGLALIFRLIEWGGGGGGLSSLKTLADWVRQGLYGAKGVLEDITVPEDEIPEEETTTVEDPAGRPTPPYTDTTVEGSARDAANGLGIGEALLYKMVEAAGIYGGTVIVLNKAALDVMASVTGATTRWLVENPKKAIMIAVACLAIAALAVAPVPGSRVAAASMSTTAFGVLGIEVLTIAEAKQVVPEVRMA